VITDRTGVGNTGPRVGVLWETRAGMSGRQRSGKFGQFRQEREDKPRGPTLMVMCLPYESGHWDTNASPRVILISSVPCIHFYFLENIYIYIYIYIYIFLLMRYFKNIR
jgi:hypothetical protein